jgi:hypothetical protein
VLVEASPPSADSDQGVRSVAAATQHVGFERLGVPFKAARFNAQAARNQSWTSKRHQLAGIQQVRHSELKRQIETGIGLFYQGEIFTFWSVAKFRNGCGTGLLEEQGLVSGRRSGRGLDDHGAIAEHVVILAIQQEPFCWQRAPRKILGPARGFLPAAGRGSSRGPPSARSRWNRRTGCWRVTDAGLPFAKRRTAYNARAQRAERQNHRREPCVQFRSWKSVPETTPARTKISPRTALFY